MAEKGSRLYKIETVEVVEEGTREEPGCFYEYLDSDPSELAEQAKPRPSGKPAQPPARTQKEASDSNGALPAQQSPQPKDASLPPTEALEKPAKMGMGDDSPTLKLDREEVGKAVKEYLEEQGLGEELEADVQPPELSDSAIEGVEVVETEEAFDEGSQMIPRIEPDVYDAATLESEEDEEGDADEAEEYAEYEEEEYEEEYEEAEEEYEEEEESEELVPVVDEEDEEESSVNGDASAAEREAPQGLTEEEEELGAFSEEDEDAQALLANDEEDHLLEPGAEPFDEEPEPPGLDPSEELEQLGEPDDGPSESLDGGEELAEGDTLGVDLDDVPELPEDIAPLGEVEEESNVQQEGSGNTPQADETAPAKSTMPEKTTGDSKRGTGRLENPRARTGKVGATTRLQRSEGGNGDMSTERMNRPVPKQGISATTHKRITVASYTVVALVVLIIGGHSLLSVLGVIGSDEEEDPGRDRGAITVSNDDNGISDEERAIEQQIEHASQAYGRLERHFAAAERARRSNDREDFRTAAIAFMRHYYQVKGYLASASRMNLELGGERVDTGEVPMVRTMSQDQREQIARQSRQLGTKRRRLSNWINDLDMQDISDEGVVVRARENYESIEAEILQMQVDEGDVEVLVDEKIEAWLGLDEKVTQALQLIESGEAEDEAETANEAISNGLQALTYFYEAVQLDEATLTDAWRRSTDNLAKRIRELSEIDGVPSLSEFKEYEDFREARNEALGR